VKYFVLCGKPVDVKKFIAVGSKTAEVLQASLKIGINDIIVPKEFYMADIANILDKHDLLGKKILSAGAEIRATDMHDFFKERGALYDAPTTYSTLPMAYECGFVDDFLLMYKIDVVTFFSPSAVNAFFAQAKMPEGVKIAVIGTTTAAAVPKKYDVIMPKEQTRQSMAELLKNLLR
jgi:uroporphyrinogen-III synthase